MTLSLILAAMLATSDAPAIPDSPQDSPMSSGKLANLCSAQSAVSLVLCGAYLQGAAEGLESAEIALGEGSADFCLPEDGISPGSLRDMFLQTLLSDPDLSDAPPGDTLLQSLGDAYPCADGGDGSSDLRFARGTAIRGHHAAKADSWQARKAKRRAHQHKAAPASPIL